MEDIRMNSQERRRLELMARVRDKQLTLVTVAELLALSYRQIKRLWRRYHKEGDAGLVHRLRGRASPRRRPAAQRQAALAHYERDYPDFGPTLAAEQLAKRDGLTVDHETLRRWLITAGLWHRRRPHSPHRQRRPRQEHAGELVQIDGSEHDWFEGRAPRAVLMVMIDDATNRTVARFYDAEETRSAFDIFGRYYDRYGLPQALYPDQDSIYQVNIPGAPDQPRPLTQFGRAMNQLAVGLRPAHSPQAKGRVERRHGVFQDRLVKELRLAGIRTLAEANRYLDDTFLPDLNARFTVVPASSVDLHRRLPRGVRLAEVLCWEEERVVARDWTLSWRGRSCQIDKRHVALSLVGRRVVVRTLLDGREQLVDRGAPLTWRELPARPAPTPRPAPAQAPAVRGTATPGAAHPWRRFGIAAGRNFRRSGARAGGNGKKPQGQNRKKGTFLTS